MMHIAWCNLEEVPYCFWELKIQWFESISIKIGRPVAAIESFIFALFFIEKIPVLFIPYHTIYQAGELNPACLKMDLQSICGGNSSRLFFTIFIPG